MIQKDYILRMIEEIGRFLARVSGMKNNRTEGKGFEEFLSFISAHFGISVDDLKLENIEQLEKKLKISFDQYPDELGQLFSGGAELAREMNKGAAAEVLYLIAWNAFRKAENDSQAYRFERLVEMNSIKEKLALMGINVRED
jgi:hypothetical protein